MKRIAIFMIMILSVSCLFGAKVESINETRYMGLELSKINRNAFVITDDDSAAPQYTDDAGWNTYVHVAPLRFIAFPSVTETTTTEVSNDIYVRYEFETPGYLYLYFTAQSDFGYNNPANPEAGKPGYYENPWMLMSVGGDGLNYNITCTSDMAYFGEGIQQGNEIVSEWVSPASSYVSSTGNQFECTTKVVNQKVVEAGDGTFQPNGASAALLDPHIHSGVVFQKKINKGHVRGMDHYNLKLVKPSDGAFPAGLYYGYIIAHFAVAE